MSLYAVRRPFKVRCVSMITLVIIGISWLLIAVPPSYATGFNTNLTSPWINYPTTSTWISTPDGMQGTGAGDNVHTSSTTASNGVVEGKITLSPNTQAGALMFRIQNQNAPWDAGYVVNINMTNGGEVKLFALPYRVIATRSIPLVANQEYTLSVTFNGAEILVQLDAFSLTDPIIRAYDPAYSTGYIGLNVYYGTATFQDVQLTSLPAQHDLDTNLSTPWSTTTRWDEIDGQLVAMRYNGDTFLTSTSMTPNDFSYSAHLRINANDRAGAAGLAFAIQNPTNPAAGAYVVNINTTGAGQVMLLKFPVQTIATANVVIDLDKDYFITVERRGFTISVYMDHATTPIISVVDTTYTNGGFLGLNAYQTAAAFQNIRFESLENLAQPINTLWTTAMTPTLLTDTSAIEHGVKFRSDRNGYIDGIRFFKSSQNTGIHLGNLWSNTGELLASAIFNNETAQGWQEVTFAESVPISANVTYIASYHMDYGRGMHTPDFFLRSGYTRGPLHALSNIESGGNGVYKLGPTGFPTQSCCAANYWVDVVFSDDANYDPLVFDEQTIWSDAVQPANPSHTNTSFVQIGTKVRADRDLLIDGLHYFNGDATISSHTARLWKHDGTLLKSMTFSNDPVVGWQYVYFDEGVLIDANTTYIISYDTIGAFPLTSNGLASIPPTEFPVIRALANGEDGGNGIYGLDGSFPPANFNGDNYWVDVIVSNAPLRTALGSGPQYQTQIYKYNGPGTEWDDTTKYTYVKVDLSDARINVIPHGATNKLPLLNADGEARWPGTHTPTTPQLDNRQMLEEMYRTSTVTSKAVLINTDYFCRPEAGVVNTCDYGAPEGLFIKNGTLYHQSFNRAALTFNISNKASIGVYDYAGEYPGIHNAVGGGPVVLFNGSLYDEICNMEQSSLEYRCTTENQARSAACISQDGYTLWLITNATGWSTNWKNLSNFMKYKLGCYNGMQFDGRSSASLIYKGVVKSTNNSTVGTGLMITYNPTGPQ